MSDEDRPRPVAMGIVGWAVTYDPDGRLFTATREEQLTAYQDGYGALPEVDARHELELRLLCSAQQHLGEVLAIAEELDLPRLRPDA